MKYLSYLFVAFIIAMLGILWNCISSKPLTPCSESFSVHVVCNTGICDINITGSLLGSDKYELYVPAIKQSFEVDMSDGFDSMQLPENVIGSHIILSQQDNKLANNCKKTIEIL